MRVLSGTPAPLLAAVKASEHRGTTRRLTYIYIYSIYIWYGSSTTSSAHLCGAKAVSYIKINRRIGGVQSPINCEHLSEVVCRGSNRQTRRQGGEGRGGGDDKTMCGLCCNYEATPPRAHICNLALVHFGRKQRRVVSFLVNLITDSRKLETGDNVELV